MQERSIFYFGLSSYPLNTLCNRTHRYEFIVSLMIIVRDVSLEKAETFFFMRNESLANLSRLYKIQYLSGLNPQELLICDCSLSQKSDVSRLEKTYCAYVHRRWYPWNSYRNFIDNLPSRFADYQCVRNGNATRANISYKYKFM